MRHLLNTLFVLSDDIYLSLENENIIAWKGRQLAQKIPLLNLENILYFGYKGASPALLGECAKRKIGFCFLNQNGRFLARVCGASYGNVFLRKEQYRLSDDERKSCEFAKYMLTGKIYNGRITLMRALRDHPLSVDQERFREVIDLLKQSIGEIQKAENLEELRGIEGNAAQLYFSVFDNMILADKKSFFFHERTKRPPMDRMNALLSFTYTILAHDCAVALESVGLDSYVGFLHRDRPGRISLALDLMEELRSMYADRFVLALVNNRVVGAKNFQIMENGAVWLNSDGRKLLLSKWQERKRDMITHPFLEEKILWGLIPYVQSLLLAKFIRKDLDGYPVFLGK